MANLCARKLHLPLRVSRQQVFVSPSGARRNQMTVLIEAEQDDPIKDGTRPFALREEAFGICFQRLDQSRNVWVTPTDQNHFPLLIATQVSRKGSRLLVAETRIDF